MTEMEARRRSFDRVLPPAGTQLWGRFKGVPCSARIVVDKNRPGERAVLYRGKTYSSLSAAARAVTLQPTNGWRFWRTLRPAHWR